MKSRYTITAVIPTLNRIMDLRKCINSVYDHVDEIVVIDNNSTDKICDVFGEGTAGTDRFRKLTILNLDDNVGPVVAQNLGGHFTDTDFILMLDNDVECLEWRYDDMLQRFIDDKTAIVWFKCLNVDYKVDYFGVHSLGSPDCIHWTGSYHNAAALINTKAFQEVGGFNDEYFAYYQEPDLSARLLKAGYNIMYFPYVKFLHKGSTESRSSDNTIYFHIRNHYWFIWEHLPLSIAIFQSLKWLGWSVLNGYNKPRIVLKAYKDTLQGMRKVLARREPIYDKKVTSLWTRLKRE
jgi:GT2 family glycosyltransferase